MTQRARALVHPRVDGWLLGGLGVVAWLVVSPVAGGSLPAAAGLVGGVFVVLSAMHFGASYHLAYGDGLRSIRRHPVALVAVPLVLAGAFSAVFLARAGDHARLAEQLTRTLLVVVFTLTGWHYVKQAFGVGMLAGRSRGFRPSRREALVLRYSLYPVWLYDVLEIYGRGRPARYQSYDVAVGIVPQAFQPWGEAIAIASLVLAFGLMVRLALRARALPPMGLWAAYLTAGLWFIAPPSYVSAAIVLAGLHGLQYLTCAHRAEVDLAVERREAHLLHRWVSVFGGAAAGGLLLTAWVPDLANEAVVVPGLPGLAGVLLFVFFNLHHYAIDAVIWRSGGEHLARISKGPQLAEPEPAIGSPAEPSAGVPALA